MEKAKVDQIIKDYLQKIYGFAVKKSFSYDEAEELCSDIVLEVYRSLLKSDEIVNIDGYVWRISEHTYAKYVSSKKRREGISIDGMELPHYDENPFEEEDREKMVMTLRREIAFLTETRRKIVFLFYYKNRSVHSISTELKIPEGTVKWHLNKARKELKEGILMERKIGELGLDPIEAYSFGHGGRPGKNGATEFYLEDKINLNIVYSVYYSPKTKEEIAEDLGLTLVFIEDKIKFLEGNGYLVKTKGDKYTTYVKFSPKTYSVELKEKATKLKLEIAKELADDYACRVRKAMADIDYENVYIPSGNRELLEAAAIFYGVSNKCGIRSDVDISKYVIKDTGGGEYIAFVQTRCEAVDPDYVPTLKDLPSYWACGDMTRWSEKYPSIYSWSVDSRLSNREGAWQNNRTEDYEYLYELIKGEISDSPATAEKLQRLKKRGFITDDKKPNIIIIKGSHKEFFSKIPSLDEAIKEKFADKAFEYAMLNAQNYPPQMQDLIINWSVGGFIGSDVSLMVMDILYSNGTFKPLSEEEKVTSNLIMFCDTFPK